MRHLLTLAVLATLACGGPTGPETSPTPEPPPESPGEVNLNTESSSHPVVDDIEVTPRQPEWMAGNTVDIEAIARDSTGARVDSFDIKWKSLNTAIVTIDSERDSLGTLSGVELGRARVAVWVEHSEGATVRHVNAFVDEQIPSDDTEPPTLDSLALSSDTIRPGEKVNVHVFASDPGAGIYKVFVGFRPAGDTDNRFTSQGSKNESGTWHDGQWILGGPADRLLEVGAAGEWEISISAWDRCYQPRTCPDDGSDHVLDLDPDDLRALGWPASVTVEP